MQFPGAVAGKVRPAKTWRPIEQATMAYGYGLSASLLQMARAYTAFARAVPGLQEVSIGHALIADALELGYSATVRDYLRSSVEQAKIDGYTQTIFVGTSWPTARTIGR